VRVRATDDSISQIGDRELGMMRRGVVLYDFVAEEEDELSVAKGEGVQVEYQMGEWYQVRSFGGCVRVWQVSAAVCKCARPCVYVGGVACTRTAHVCFRATCVHL
jgi:hypothetical protein